ncbi:MAG: glycosyltransferase family 4 protein [Ignavibacteriaceae bacterium]|nr:glycosyltransferase family 4 protein [Ignavibacteriaceae bacterium]
MKDLLLAAYSKFPSMDEGGPNKVISQIISGLDFPNYRVRYISKDVNAFLSSQLKGNYPKISFKKNVGKFLQSKSALYRSIVTHPLYLKKYFRTAQNNFVRLLSEKIETNILHAHDARAFFFLKDIPARKKILSIHSKGKLTNDLNDYFRFSGSLEDVKQQFEIMESEALENADVITFPSLAARELFFKEKQFDLSKSRIIYNGINFESIRTFNLDLKAARLPVTSKDCIKILNVADHIKSKNIELIIETIRHLRDEYKREILFVNIGAGPLTVNYKRLIKKYNLDLSVVFLSRLPNSAVIGLMKAFDYFISAGERVIFDLVILEAMACGMCIIARDDGGNREVINDGVNGYLFSKNDPEQIASLIIKTDFSIKVNAIETAKKFDLRNTLLPYFELYESA